ncbi:MAG TPA: family 16 glycoside hydrolase, partial [Candidatus Tumulicola sp.]|nr:family 16 glycoside hydrolase [Candidatus Tumulicola sp.]
MDALVPPPAILPESSPMPLRPSALLGLLALVLFTVRVQGEPLNTPPEDFVALFNGRDLEGWRGASTEDPRIWQKLAPEQQAEKLKAQLEDIHKHWTVEEGELVNDGKGLYLTTIKDYGDFEL